MKRFFLLILLLFSTILPIYSQTLITQQDAWDIVQQKVLEDNIQDINIYVSDNYLDKNTVIKTIYQDEHSPLFDSWFFFIDDNPFKNWNHACRYVFVNVHTGDFVVYNKTIPPILDNFRVLNEVKLSNVDILTNILKIKKSNVAQSNTINLNNYAVILSGGANPQYNYERYWNECAILYTTLVHKYKYPKENIYVLISDGDNQGKDRHKNDGTYDSSPTDLDGDGVSDVRFSATKSNITNVFNELQKKLSEKDNLLIFTTDHGGQISSNYVYINLWNNEILHDYEFANEVNKVKAAHINICMEQCHSGGFIDNLTQNNRTISTACAYDESSWAMSNRLYNEFAYHWISAVLGETPYGSIVDADYNKDGLVSIEEAFQYAKANDTQKEHPQYNSTPSSLGSIISLHGLIPSISGPSFICSSATYRIDNLPLSARVEWSCTDNLRIQGQGNSYATFEYIKGSVSAFTAIKAKIIYGGYEFSLSRTIHIGTNIFIQISKTPGGIYMNGGEAGIPYYIYAVPTDIAISTNSQDFKWTVSSSCITDASNRLPMRGHPLVFTPPSEGTYTFNLVYNGDCGEVSISKSYHFYQKDNSGGGTVIVSPNPSTDGYATVKIKKLLRKEMDSDAPLILDNNENDIEAIKYSVKSLVLPTFDDEETIEETFFLQVWSNGQLIKSLKSENSNQLNISTADLAAGIYQLVVILENGEFYGSTQLIVY